MSSIAGLNLENKLELVHIDSLKSHSGILLCIWNIII